MRGGLATVAAYWVGLSTAMASPSDPDLRIVSQHEPVRARLDRLAVDTDVSADEAVDHPVRQVADGGSLEHDAVLDLGLADFDVAANRRERPHIGVDNPRAAADDRGPADHGTLDGCALLDHHLAFDAAFGVHGTINPPLERLENQPVGLEHVFELPRIFPPALDDVRPHGEAAIDQILDGVGDFELVAEARFDPVDRLEHLRAKHVHADQREIANRL